jgi:hypothetical protein
MYTLSLGNGATPRQSTARFAYPTDHFSKSSQLIDLAEIPASALHVFDVAAVERLLIA